MKHNLHSLVIAAILVIVGLKVDAQFPIVCAITFENDSCYVVNYTIDNSQAGSIWNICIPNKTIFDSAYTKPKAILTDSAAPYPINDTSSFIIKFVNYPGMMNSLIISGEYKMDSDTLTDYGKIEISSDYGHTWYDIITHVSSWLTPIPVFSGRIHEWRHFYGEMVHIPLSTDTIWYRFTFISDSNQTNREGWILDDIGLLIHTEGIQENQIQNNISIYPNPATDNLTIYVSTTLNIPAIIEITNIQGQVIEQQTTNFKTTNIDVSMLARGMYFVKVKTEKTVESKKFVKL